MPRFSLRRPGAVRPMQRGVSGRWHPQGVPLHAGAPLHARLAQQSVRGLACALLCTLLAACGFHLRGTAPLPFDSLYTNIAENSAFGAQMRRAIEASSPNTRIVEDAALAQAKLIQLASNQSLRQLSINAQGLVDEYELNLTFTFEVVDAKGHILMAPTTLTSSRDLPYDPNAVQAKQGEIGTVFKEMQQGLVDRVVRRLSAPDVIEAARRAGTQNIKINPADIPSGHNAAPAAVPWSIPRIEPGAGVY
ncbi:LPS-assembly lipoprotein [Paralcaligenes ureilyticus]|uniref:LPS-assembly lipoprotein LptE n=2 Tax=Paralcaligenes ureilyticus TaxID=627131 RepID=A0A4R3M5D5_9BURK|nr:LPS-assembly lipoprotein [Paralcaligenes ureilyticus]